MGKQMTNNKETLLEGLSWIVDQAVHSEIQNAEARVKKAQSYLKQLIEKARKYDKLRAAARPKKHVPQYDGDLHGSVGSPFE